jgi:hypothetical protein
VTVEERPADASDNLPVVLTLTVGPKAIETQVHLDLQAQPR